MKEQQLIESLRAALVPVVEARAEQFKNGEAGDWRAQDVYSTAVKQIIALWVSECPELREAHVEFGGGYTGSESIYVTAYVYDTADDLNIVAEMEKERISFHAARR